MSRDGNSYYFPQVIELESGILKASAYSLGIVSSDWDEG